MFTAAKSRNTALRLSFGIAITLFFAHLPATAQAGDTWENLAKVQSKDTWATLKKSGVPDMDKSYRPAATKNFEKILALAKQSQKDRHALQTLKHLARLMENDGQYEKAAALYLQIQDCKPNDEELAEARSNAGRCLLLQGRFKEAELHLVKSLDQLRMQATPKHGLSPDSLTLSAHTLDNLARAYMAQGAFKQAESASNQASNLYDKNVGCHVVARALNTRALEEMQRGNYTSARELLKGALLIFDKQPSKFGQSESLLILVRNDMEQGKFATCEERIYTAWNLRKPLVGMLHPATAECWFLLGALNLRSSKYDQAFACFNQSYTIKQTAFGEHNPHPAADLLAMSLCRLALGDLGGANAYFEKSIKAREEILGKQDAVSAAYKQLFVRRLWGTGHLWEAVRVKATELSSLKHIEPILDADGRLLDKVTQAGELNQHYSWEAILFVALATLAPIALLSILLLLRRLIRVPTETAGFNQFLAELKGEKQSPANNGSRFGRREKKADYEKYQYVTRKKTKTDLLP